MEIDSPISLTIPCVPTQLHVTGLETELDGDTEQGWDQKVEAIREAPKRHMDLGFYCEMK